MCTIDKMLIKGIRSFSPDNQHVIEFYKPLTLIVGHNGAGKTTVIECLKQACTGELPPNTRSGQSFVHDPKVAGETEVKAQIKLRFRTATGQPVVVIRSFQLSQKQRSLQFKALDQTLQSFNRDTGQKEALSYRCADMDRMVPSMMGVSKAILENVIFVHQEDSNWPLSEGQVLKRKFDDIFAATKYTKALEALRKLRVEKVGELKEFRLKLDHLSTHKDNATKLRNELQGGQSRSAELQEKIWQINTQIAEHDNRIAEVTAQLGAIGDAADQLATLKAQQDMMVKHNAETLARITSAYPNEDFDIDIADLEEMAAATGSDVATVQARLRELTRELANRRMEVEAVKDEYARQVKAQGRLSAEAEGHARNVAERDRTIRSIATQAGLPLAAPAEGPLPSAAIASFQSALEGALSAARARVSEVRSLNRQADELKGAEIERLARQLAGVHEAVRLNNQAVQRTQARVQELQKQMDGMSVSRTALAAAEEAAREAEEAVAKRRARLVDEGYDAALAAANERLEQLRRRASTLRQERERLSLASESATRLRLKRQEVESKAEQLEAQLATRRDTLLKVLGTTALPAPEQLREALESVQAQRQREQEARGAELKSRQERCARAEGELATLRSQLRASQSEAAALSKRLQQGMRAAFGMLEEGAELEALRERHEGERARSSENLQRVTTLEIQLKHIKRHAEETCACPTCGRELNGERELRSFLQRQDEDMESIPASRTKLEAAMAELDTKLAALRALQPQYLRHETLVKTQVPATQQRIAELEAALAGLRESASEAADVAALAEHEVAEAARLVSEVGWPVQRAARELVAARGDLARLQGAASAADGGRDVGSVDEELEGVEEDKARAEKEKERLQAKQAQRKEEVAAAASASHKAREELHRVRTQAERWSQLHEQVSSLQQAQEQQDASCASEQARIEPLQQQRRQLMSEREAQRGEASAAEDEAEAALRALTSSADTLGGKAAAVEEYVSGNKAAALQSVTASIQQLQKRQAEAELAIKSLEEQQAQCEAQVRGAEDERRQVQDILGFQRSKVQEAALGQQIKDLDAQISQIGDSNALKRQYAAEQAATTELRRQQDMMRGSLGTIADSVQRAQRDLLSPQYTDIDERYKRQLIELKTTEMANSDLEKYHKALEKALLAFHSTKMADINKIIKEMWQKTYRNSDIDYIQIKADADGQRSYNYRVVMYSGGAELDMRGRCSAGQKVLACLIIRLALAETFCLNCGILALDEPTTNLDAANSASLADALRNVMLSRKEQDNFQLVVITHDERFAQLIGTREHAEYMWRITKDDNGHSIIGHEAIMG